MIQILKKINIEFDLITFDSQPNLPYTITKIENECFEEEYQKPYIYCMCNQEEYTKITEYYDAMVIVNYCLDITHTNNNIILVKKSGTLMEK